MHPSVIIAYLLVQQNPEILKEQTKAKQFLEDFNKRDADRHNRLKISNWNYDTDMTDANLQRKLSVLKQVAREKKLDWTKLQKYNWTRYYDKDLRRQFKKNAELGDSALIPRKYTKLKKIINTMTKIYSRAKICDYRDQSKCDLSLEPDLVNTFANSHDPKELEHAWLEWRKATGPANRLLYEEYVDLENEAARLNKYKNNEERWLASYENPVIVEQLEYVWEDVKPLYLQLHAYVRTNLRKKYGDIVPEKGPIPAHLLGNMWGQRWDNLVKFIRPFPNKTQTDLSEELMKQHYTPLKIAKTAEDFFLSINLTAMPESFWKKSIFEKPHDRQINCHPSAWDFYDGKDFRIKVCLQTNLKNFVLMHHEMGHVEYYLQYKDQPLVYRNGANNGFQEAIGELIALSVQSPKHLRRIGLLKEKNNDTETTINSLFEIALKKIALLPFAYMVDAWRWNVFREDISSEDYNCKWWQFREKFQGVEPPVDRSEKDFDPAAKYHIVNNTPFIRYFISNILQFQFHRALCITADEFDPKDPSKPLHMCDIYNSTKAGNALKKMLALGSSKPWPDAIEMLTGQRTMDALAILEYFQPLQKWLEEENKKSGAFIGWEKSSKKCTK